jgi:hypothetical protein
MAKEDVVAAGLVALQEAQAEAVKGSLAEFYDKVVADQPPVSGGLSQADLEAAVADALAKAKAESDAAIAAIQSADAQALSDAQAKAASDFAAVQQALADMTAKEQLEEGAIAGLKDSLDKVQAFVDQIKSILPSLFPPAPAPQPEQSPESPSA